MVGGHSKANYPDPAEIGNAGQFFKNPVIAELAFRNLEGPISRFARISGEDRMVKVPAGWIDQAG